MNVRHVYLPFAQLASGMVLAHPLILTERGRVTLRLPSGHILSEASLAQLATHRAEYACVEKEDLRSDQEKEAEHAQQEKRLAEIFKSADLKTEATQVFYQALLNYRKS